MLAMSAVRLDLIEQLNRLPSEVFAMVCQLALSASNPIILHSPVGMSRKKLAYKYEFDEHAFGKLKGSDKRRATDSFRASIGTLLYAKSLHPQYREWAEVILLRCNTIKVESAAASRHLVDVGRELSSRTGRAIYAGCVLVEVGCNQKPQRKADLRSARRGWQICRILPIGPADSDYESAFEEEGEANRRLTGDIHALEGDEWFLNDPDWREEYISGRRAFNMLDALTDLERLDLLHVVMHPGALVVDQWAAECTGEYEQRAGQSIRWQRMLDVMYFLKEMINATSKREHYYPPTVYNSATFCCRELIEVNDSACCVMVAPDLCCEIELWQTQGVRYMGAVPFSKASWWEKPKSSTPRQ